MTAAFVYAAVRTPFGRFGGALAEVRPDDLAATAITGVLAKAPGLDPGRIGDVVWGCANQAGEDNRNVGRMAVPSRSAIRSARPVGGSSARWPRGCRSPATGTA
ncbi:hypothetical protein Aple_004170 [Acrocarpospora pleiomorpha]|uniref:Thiolase N-terminal domain-containing protein n=1 Tax=Acrocarpospora pleiomorpha TaxID=90975 RepID=A0A5M3X9W2_9ACTN|nr:hypothetical protein Aple_004170 [Acrocarpospora pleiomorpha]